MNAHSPAPSTSLIPLDQLYLHAFNPRPNASEDLVESKASSIAICGLMQNLMGYRDPDDPTRVGIVAGGLRLRGLQKLAAEKWNRYPDLKPIDTVPVQVTEDPIKARAWAAAENVSRADLNPADEALAYAAMAGQGNTAAMIAAAFGVTEARVAKRLRLASLPVPALKALREGKIGIDVARALTLSSDRDRQIAVLADAIRQGHNQHQVRRMLTEGMVPMTDHRAIFVGREIYELEGGLLTEDLWGDGFLHDEVLLDRLFKEKLERKAEDIRIEEGWQWAEACVDGNALYRMTDKFRRIYRERVELPDADIARAEELSDFERVLTPEEEAELRAIAAREEGDFSDEQRAEAGIVVRVTYHGDLDVHRAFLKPGVSLPGDKVGSTREAAAVSADPKPAIPQACMDDLARIRLQALQRALLDKPNLMLDLLAYTLDLGASYEAPIAVSLSTPPNAPEKDSGLLTDQRLIDAGMRPDGSPRPSVEGFATFRAEGQKHRNTVLTHRLARAVQPSQLFAALWTESGAEIRKHWTPDAENFFGRVRTDLLDSIWSELTGDLGDTAAFAKLKKGDKAKQLEKLFADASVRETLGLSREQNTAIDAWLPDPMVMEDAA